MVPIDGLVSNCWSALLPRSSLAEQCRLARERGFSYIELRQGALGELGGETGVPTPAALRGFTEGLPGVRFNLAIEVPFQSREIQPEDCERLEPWRSAALALAPPGEAVLRLVDLSPPEGLPEPDRLLALAAGCARLVAWLWREGCTLALENSRLPVWVTLDIIRRAAAQVEGEAPGPRLCWDPANQVQHSFSPEDPVLTAASFAPGELFEFHYKQVVDGAVAPDVREGVLPWKEILAALAPRARGVPALFEIPAGPDVWDRIAAGEAYLRAL